MEKKEKIETIKWHISNVICEESNNCKKSPSVFVLDKKDFFEDSSFTRLNKKYKLVSDNSLLSKVFKIYGYFDVPKWLEFMFSGGFTNGKEITILLHNNIFKGNFNDHLFYEVFAIFHEFRHIWQWEQIEMKKDNITDDFETFRGMIERSLHLFMPTLYYLKHDNFYFEIDANIYGTEKAREYFLKNNILASNGLQERYFEDYYSKMLTYDFDYFLKMYNIIYKNHLNYKLKSSYTYSIFYDRKGNFRKLDEITKNPSFYTLGNKLKMEMLSSNSFLSSINYNLNDIDKSLLFEFIDAKIMDLYDAYNKNRIFFDNGTFKEKAYLQNAYILLSRMGDLLRFKLKYQKSIKGEDNVRENYDLSNILGLYLHEGNLFLDSNNLKRTNDLYFVINYLQESILKEIDLKFSPLDAELKRIDLSFKPLDAEYELVDKNGKAMKK